MHEFLGHAKDSCAYTTLLCMHWVREPRGPQAKPSHAGLCVWNPHMGLCVWTMQGSVFRQCKALCVHHAVLCAWTIQDCVHHTRLSVWMLQGCVFGHTGQCLGVRLDYTELCVWTYTTMCLAHTGLRLVVTGLCLIGTGLCLGYADFAWSIQSCVWSIQGCVWSIQGCPWSHYASPCHQNGPTNLLSARVLRCFVSCTRTPVSLKLEPYTAQH